MQLRLKKILDLRQFTMCFLQLGWKGPNLSLLKPPLNHCEKPFWTWELNVNCAFWWFVSVSHIYVLPTITQRSLAICTHADFQILIPVCCECDFSFDMIFHFCRISWSKTNVYFFWLEKKRETICDKEMTIFSKWSDRFLEKFECAMDVDVRTLAQCKNDFYQVHTSRIDSWFILPCSGLLLRN